MHMRWIVLAGHLALLIVALTSLVYWYEVERAFYCHPVPVQRCSLFTFQLPLAVWLEIYVVALIVTALPQFLTWVGKPGNAPEGHAVYLIKTVPTSFFAGIMVYLTEGRAGANDIEWIAIAVACMVLLLATRGLWAFVKGRILKSGAGWIFALICLMILAAMSAITFYTLQNMDRLF